MNKELFFGGLAVIGAVILFIGFEVGSMIAEWHSKKSQKETKQK